VTITGRHTKTAVQHFIVMLAGV